MSNCYDHELKMNMLDTYYFKDNIKKYGVIYGAFDEHNKKYTVSLQEGTDQDDDATLSFDDRINGWVSFYSGVRRRPNHSRRAK